MNLHIVHVEDDKPLRSVLSVALRAAEPQIDLHQFTAADEAVTYIETYRETIDLFVIDIRLPGKLNGLELAQKIRDLNCPGHLILTSAFNSPSHALLKALRAEYFPKPWHLLEITQNLLNYHANPLAQTPSEPPSLEVIHIETAREIAAPTIQYIPPPVKNTAPPSTSLAKTAPLPKLPPISDQTPPNIEIKPSSDRLSPDTER